MRGRLISITSPSTALLMHCLSRVGTVTLRWQWQSSSVRWHWCSGLQGSWGYSDWHKSSISELKLGYKLITASRQQEFGLCFKMNGWLYRIWDYLLSGYIPTHTVPPSLHPLSCEEFGQVKWHLRIAVNSEAEREHLPLKGRKKGEISKNISAF